MCEEEPAQFNQPDASEYPLPSHCQQEYESPNPYQYSSNQYNLSPDSTIFRTEEDPDFQQNSIQPPIF